MLSKALKVKKCFYITAKCEKDWSGKFDFVIEVKASKTVCSILIAECTIDLPVYMPEILSVVAAYECQSIVFCSVYIMHNNHLYFTVVHERCFVTFMVTSELYMMLTCYLLRCMRCKPPNNIEARSLRIKYQLLAVNLMSFAMAVYFFIRHNSYCERGGNYDLIIFNSEYNVFVNEQSLQKCLKILITESTRKLYYWCFQMHMINLIACLR